MKKKAFLNSYERVWTPEREALLYETYDRLKDIKTAVNKFTESYNYKKTSVWGKLRTHLHMFGRQAKTIELPTSSYEINRKFVENRAKQLMRFNIGLDIEKASEMARDGITHNAKPQQSFELPQFPAIWPLTEESSKVFEQMLINLVANGGKLSLFSVRDTVMLQKDMNWNGQLWRQFCEQVQIALPEICKSLIGCNPQKLKVVIENGYHYIVYR